MSQGLLYDSAHRLLVANRRYHEIFRLAAGGIVVGMEATEVLRRNIEVGSHPSLNADEALAEIGGLIWSGSAAQIQRLADGRHVSIEMRAVLRRFRAAFYEDATERWQAEEPASPTWLGDALTDLPNRLLLRERVEARSRWPPRPASPCSASTSTTSSRSTTRSATPSATTAASSGAPAAGLPARGRHRGPARRRRVRGDPGRRREPGGCRHAGAPHPRRGERTLRAHPPFDHGRPYSGSWR